MTRRGKAFTPMATIEAEEYIASCYDGPLFEGPVVVEVDYTYYDQTITIRDWADEYCDEVPPKWQADVDNLLKLTLDALQREGGPLVNDKQVLSLAGAKW